MAIDESRQDGHLAEVDDPRIGWYLDLFFFANFFDLAAADQDYLIGEDCAGVSIDQVTSADCRNLRSGSCGQEKHGRIKKKRISHATPLSLQPASMAPNYFVNLPPAIGGIIVLRLRGGPRDVPHRTPAI
jgi:hypothetical protein